MCCSSLRDPGQCSLGESLLFWCHWPLNKENQGWVGPLSARCGGRHEGTPLRPFLKLKSICPVPWLLTLCQPCTISPCALEYSFQGGASSF